MNITGQDFQQLVRDLQLSQVSDLVLDRVLQQDTQQQL